MILVLDSSALITLSRTGDLGLLRQLADTVHVPQAVYDEVVGAGANQPGGRAVGLAQWIVRHRVQDQDTVVRLRGRLGRGEAEAIVLAKDSTRTLWFLMTPRPAGSLRLKAVTSLDSWACWFMPKSGD